MKHQPLTRQGSRTRTACVACLFALSSFSPLTAYAQDDPIDFDAPIIEHEFVPDGLPERTQTFSVTVVDETAVNSVTLNYRFDSSDEFKSLKMKPLNNTSLYTGSIDVDETAVEAIEYYIEADDVAGNTVLRGYSFDPLVRRLLSPELQPEAVADATVLQAPPPPAPELEAKGGSNVWWYVAGAVVVGAIAAAASAGGDDDGRIAGDEDCCSLTLTINQP